VELTFLFVGLPAYVQDLPSTLYDGKNDTSLPLVRLAQVKRDTQYLPSSLFESATFWWWTDALPRYANIQKALPRGVNDRKGKLDQKRDDSRCCWFLSDLASQRESGNASYPHNFQTTLIDHGYLFGKEHGLFLLRF
jgi:hypothetical protein